MKFTKKERADPALAKHIQKADAAADKLDKARLKIPEKKPEGKLRFTVGQVKGIGVLAGKEIVRGAHGKIYEVENDNVAVKAAHKAEKLAERGAGRLIHAAAGRYKLRHFRAAAKAEKKLIKANANAAYRQALRNNPQLAKANPLSKAWQKRKIKRAYAKSFRQGTSVGTKNIAQKTIEKIKKIIQLIARNWQWIGFLGAAVFFIMFMFSVLTFCAGMVSGGLTTVIATSYTSEDEDIIAVDEYYTALEDDLRRQMSYERIEAKYSGYSRYELNIDEIGHDPFELASYLTAEHQSYTLRMVKNELERILAQQYTLTLEVRRTVVDGAVIRTLIVTLNNHAISSVVADNLNTEQKEMYKILMETKGNKSYLFEDNPYVNRGEYTHYTIPPDALTDTKFAAMMREAEKYLGYPYVWGGSSPSTSFDCSGFVCWVINQSGVGSVGRVNTDGLYDYCTPIPPSAAQPGDLIFFERTYNVSGTSHVGIYVGNGMMIHCGNPISYASVNSAYWQDHFYGYGRLP